MSASLSHPKSKSLRRLLLNNVQQSHTVGVSSFLKFKQHETISCKKIQIEMSKRNMTITCKRWKLMLVSAKGKLSDISSSVKKDKGTVIGAVSLIIGTSIGSGILALPHRTSPAGFMPSAISIVLCWIFLVIEALVLAEINIYLRKKKKKTENPQISNNLEVISIRTMVQETLGEWGGNLAAYTYIFLSYTSMVAYTSKSGELVSRIIDLPSSTCGTIFTVLLTLLVLVGGTNITDRVNQWLTFSMIGLVVIHFIFSVYAILLYVTSFVGLLVGIEVSALSSGSSSSAILTRSNWEEIPQAIPVIIFSLVFHDIIPVICAYLGGDIIRVRMSILLGSLVPLLSLLIWDYIVLLDGTDTLDFLGRGKWSNALPIVDVFSILAVGTSLIGTLLGFSQFFLEQLVSLSNASPLIQIRGILNSVSIEDKPKKANWWERNKVTCLATSMALVPSIIISTLVPDAFSAATDIAGGYCMTILYGVLPPVMAWTLQHPVPAKINGQPGEVKDKGYKNQGTFSNAKPILIGVGLLSCGIVMDQVFQDLILIHLQQ